MNCCWLPFPNISNEKIMLDFSSIYSRRILLMKSCVSCSHVGYDNVVSCFMLCGCLADVRRENNNQQKCKYLVSQLRG